jgi:hypothetical protein
LSDRYPEATLTQRFQIPLARAALAVRRGDAAGALELLEPLKPYDHSMTAEFWPQYLRGQAYLLARDGRSAAAQFQGIVEHPGEQPVSPLYGLAILGKARGLAMAGDAVQARDAYQEFLTVWATADPALPAIAEARREAARLQ